MPPADKDELLTRKNIKFMKKSGLDRARPPLHFHEMSNDNLSPSKFGGMGDGSPDKQMNTLSPVRSSPMKSFNRYQSGSSHNVHMSSDGGGTVSNFS